MSELTRREISKAIAAMACGPLLAGPARAREFRGFDRAPRIVVPFAAGGTADGLGRLVAEILNAALPAGFSVDNRSGRNGSVGAEIVARASPDGQTLLLGTLGTAVTNQLFDRYVEYDGEASFTPVARVGEVANVLLVHPDLPVWTLADFVERVRRAPPGSLAFATPGVGSTGHLFMELFRRRAGIRLAHVSFGGRTRMMRALLDGRVKVAMDNLPPYLVFLASGAVRALGITSAERCDWAPGLPTIAEQGYPGFEATHWWHVAAPAGTRLSLVRRLSDELVRRLSLVDARRRIEDWGAIARPADAEALAAYMASERAKWRSVIVDGHLVVP